MPAFLCLFKVPLKGGSSLQGPSNSVILVMSVLEIHIELN